MKELAAHLDLSPTTLSLVLNESAAASAIPQETKDRIFEAARKFNYRPNFIARSLRAQRTYTVGVLAPELSDGYSAMVLSGVEDQLLQEGYFYFVASHRHRAELLERYPQFFLDRSVEGLIAVDTPQRHAMPLPVVSISGYHDVAGVTNIVLDHERAASLAIVIGFDDVHAAAFHNPALTTIRQPLHQMGQLAAKHLLERIAKGPQAPFPEIVTVEPELVVRQSTARAR